MRNGALSVFLIPGDKDYGKIIEEMIKTVADADITIEHAKSIRSGIDRLDSGNIDVILLDSRPSNPKGAVLLGLINKSYPRIPVVILTEQKRNENKTGAVNDEIERYLDKNTLTPNLLVDSLRSAAMKGQTLRRIAQFEERFQAIFKGIPNPTYIWRRREEDFILTDYNDAALAITDGKIPNYVGQSVRELYRDFPQIIKDLEQCYNERITINRQMLYHYVSTGRALYLQLIYRFLPPDIVLVHTVDITEQKRAEEILKHSHTMLEKKVQGRTEELARLNENLNNEIQERKLIQKALVESERKYRLVVENTNEGIAIGQDEVIKFVNPKLCEILGYSFEEMLGRPFLEFIHPEEHDTALSRYRQALKKVPLDLPTIYRFVGKEKNVIWVEIHHVMIDWEGRPAVLIFFKDITDRKINDDALKESEEKYRLVVENANEAIIISQDTHMRFLNSKAIREMGYSRKELLERPFIDFIHPDDREMVMDYHRRGLSGEPVPATFTYRIVTSDGSVKWVEVNGVLISWDGKPSALLFIKDITEQKGIEEKLKKSEERYRLVVENSKEIIIVSQNEIVKFANIRIKELFGYWPHTIIGKRLSDLVYKDDQKRMRREYRKRASGEEILESYRYRLHDSMGNERFIEVSGVDVIWEGLPAILSFVTDVTEKVKAERALYESEDFTRELVKNSPLGIIYLDQHGTIIYENPMSWKITTGIYDETRPSRALGMNIYDLPGIRQYPESTKAIDMLLHGRTMTDYTIPFLSLSGKVTILNVFGAPRRSSDGAQVGAFILISDITEKIHAEEEIKRRLHYEEAVAYCSRELVSSNDFEAVLKGIIQKLHDTIGINMILIDKILDDPREGMCVKLLHEATPEGFDNRKSIPGPRYVAYKRFSQSFWDALTQGLPYGGRKSDQSKRDQEIMEEVGILSGLVFPIHVEDRFYGIVSFNDFVTEREWSDDDVLLLQTISSMIGTAVTRKDAEHALVESERRYREFVNNTSDFFYVMDGRGNIKFLNSAIRQLGYEPEEMIGKNVNDLYAPTSKKYAEELFRMQIAGAKLRGYELEMIRKDGKIRTIEFREDMKWEGNRIVEIQGIGRDVTERRRREDRLRLMAEGHEAVLNSFDEAVFFVDSSLKITWANNATPRLTKSSIEELVGRYCYEALQQQDKPCDGCPAATALRTGQVETSHSTIHFRRKSRTAAYPVIDTLGVITGIAVMIGNVDLMEDVDISRSITSLDETEEEHDTDLFLAPLDPSYIYPLSLFIDYKKDSFLITLKWDEDHQEFALKRLARSESAMARFLYLAAKMKSDGSGWVDKDAIRVGTMDTNLNKLRSILVESNIPFLDRFSARMLIRSNKEEKKKVRLAISPSNIEISPNISNFQSKKHLYLVSVTKKIKKLKKEMTASDQPKEYLMYELSVQKQNEINIKKSIEVVESLIKESAEMLGYRPGGRDGGPS